MKLGEALNERARLAKSVAELRDVMGTALVVQEGEDPITNATDTLDATMDTIDEIGVLVARINKTNAATKLENGKTITEALADRDRLSAQVAFVEYAMRTLTGQDDLYGRAYRRTASELRQIRQMDLDTLTRRRDLLAKERRTLDAELQALNWTTDLVE